MGKKLLILIPILFTLLAAAQQDSILSGMYTWKMPKKQKDSKLATVVLFKGKTTDMSYLQMTANCLSPGRKKNRFTVPSDKEYLLLIKSGRLTMKFNDSTSILTPNSIAVLMPGEHYTLANTENDDAEFYLMTYTSASAVDLTRGKLAGGSFVKQWEKIPFRSHDKGGVRSYFERPTAMCSRLEMHVTTLNEGLRSHDPHTHRAEEIILMIENKAAEQINQQIYKGGAGTIFYLGSNQPHAITNDGVGPCMYFAFQFQ